MRHALLPVTEESDWQIYHAIRRSALWEERGLSGYDDDRPEERYIDNHPLLLTIDGQGCGTTRLDDMQDGTGIIRLVAVSAPLRRQGYGRLLDALVEQYARNLGIDVLFVSAAVNAERFYTATGWARCVADVPEHLSEADHCVRMTKRIAR
jgi:N-acetylglutamate synthase-like GNAT family acetyltransferase